ncbi:MAG: ATP-binding cassette domain-containing protein [Erysipelotrichaceae bacterium]
MIKVEHIGKKFIRNIKNDSKKKFASKTIKEEFLACNDITLEANSGEIVGILGPNGAGKTTLLRMMAGIMSSTTGYVEIDGLTCEKNNDEYKMKIGYLSGNTKLYARLTPIELLRTFGEIYGLTKQQIEERTNSIIKTLNMEEFKDNRIERLSTGQMQRINIARCLIHDPKIYIFDEPTLGLDVLSSKSIIDFMKNEKKLGKTVIYSTHYMEEAQILCDKIYMIHNGEIIANGTPTELQKQTNTNNLRDTFFKLIEEDNENEN